MSYFRKLFIIGVVFLSATVNSFALKAEYRFEACNGSATTKNHQGSGLDGTLSGDANITLGNGKIQNALTLSGDGMMSVEHSLDLDLIENLTIAFWVKPQENRRQALIVRGGGSGKFGSNAEYSLVLWENGKFKYKHNNTADTFSTSTIALNEWTHIALVRDNGIKNIKIYINGVLDANRSYSIDPSSSNSEKLIIGSGDFYSNTMNNLKGQLDEIKIYNLALSSNDITALYTSENGGTHQTGECTPHRVPNAVDDSADLPVNGTVVVNVLSNDTVYDNNRCELNSSTVKITSHPNGSTLSDNNRTLTVSNQGVWSVMSSGSIKFVSYDSFYNNPTDISYRVMDSCGALSSEATVSLTRVAPIPTATPNPTPTPTANPTPAPTIRPTVRPTVRPTEPVPTLPPESEPTVRPTARPTTTPSTPTPRPTSDTTDSEDDKNSGVTIGDKVWYDRNSNGIQDKGEEGVDGVIVVLFNSSGGVVERTTTNASGEYHFNNVRAGSYSLGFSNLPTGYIFTSQNMGDNDAKDSDVNRGGRVSSITVKDKDNLTYDAGIVLSTETGDGGVVVDNNNTQLDANCDCDDYSSSIPSVSKIGMMAILILVGLLGTFFIKEEEFNLNIK
jgi:hypothetical protein